MEWIQVYIIMATTLSWNLLACLLFYIITAKRIDRTDQMIDINNKNHREDMARMDEKFIRMDEKWERLFEKMWIKEHEKF